MHTSYLPTGQRSRLKEVIQMQISSHINPRKRRNNQFFLSCFTRSASSFCLSVLRSLFWFRLSGDVPCSFTHVCSFRSTLSLSFRRLFGARQSTAGVSLAHVVMSSPAKANTAPLEPNVVIANEVHDAVEVDDTDHVEFDLDELKEQLGIDSILEKLNEFAAKFCSGKTRTEHSGSEAQNSKSSSETAEGVFDPSSAVVPH